MLEHAIYSVISPEGCASILWKDATNLKMQLTLCILQLKIYIKSNYRSNYRRTKRWGSQKSRINSKSNQGENI